MMEYSMRKRMYVCVCVCVSVCVCIYIYILLGHYTVAEIDTALQVSYTLTEKRINGKKRKGTKKKHTVMYICITESLCCTAERITL